MTDSGHKPAADFSTDAPKDVIDVAVVLPVHTPFTYRVPLDLMPAVAIGKRVLVPFGRRRITAYVLGPSLGLPATPLKSVIEVLDESALFPSQMVAFFQWIADYYMHPLGEVIQVALPSGLTVADHALVTLTDLGRQVLNSSALTPEEKIIIEQLLQSPCRLSQLQRGAQSQQVRKALANWERQGWLLRSLELTGARTRRKTMRYVYPVPNASNSMRLSAARSALLAELDAHGPLALAELQRRIPSSGSLVRAMDADGQVMVRDQAVYRDPFGEPIEPDQPPTLMAEQQAAVQTIQNALGKGFQAFLLAGVTGSGKTEIYLHLAQAALRQQRTVLVLVPEIALISQMERAFRARFGECVALLHSGLSSGERFDQWLRLARGEATIAVGARSAIFAPLSHLGLIIVDEEHDDSYKQEGALRYNARDLAVVRARQENALAVLGSATPSMQSAYNVQIGKFQKVSLFERVDNRVLPEIVIEDLAAAREERGLRRFMTPALIEAIGATLARKEQVLLFLNRRGFSSTLVCAACGEPMRCDRCDISLTYHQTINAYQCHYCGFSRDAVARCNRCGSDRIKRLGVGTEKLEESILTAFPAARVARMDRDSTRLKGSIVKILKGLRDRTIDILVGTQMVAKGHDFPFITLVGIICADLSLSMPDFRAGERTFQLLAQVAGRAGRGQAPGRVILQTYNPDHFSIAAARQQDFDAFYRQEIEFRKALRYPPLTRMIQIRISGKDQRKAADQAKALGDRCQQLAHARSSYAAVEILGPIEAPVHRIADQYRWQLLLKAPQANPLHQLVREVLFDRQGHTLTSKVSISVDVDPVFLM